MLSLNQINQDIMTITLYTDIMHLSFTCTFAGGRLELAKKCHYVSCTVELLSFHALRLLQLQEKRSK